MKRNIKTYVPALIFLILAILTLPISFLIAQTTCDDPVRANGCSPLAYGQFNLTDIGITLLIATSILFAITSLTLYMLNKSHQSITKKRREAILNNYTAVGIITFFAAILVIPLQPLITGLVCEKTITGKGCALSGTLESLSYSHVYITLSALLIAVSVACFIISKRYSLNKVS